MTRHRSAYSLTILALAALAIGALVQSGATSQQPANWKIGVVDMDGVREGHTWLKKQYEQLETLVAELEAELQPLQDQIDAMTEEFNANKETLNAVDRMTRESEIREKTLQYRNGWQKRQLQIDEKEVEVNREAFQDIQTVIEGIASEEGYHLVLRAQDDPRSQVLYFSTTIDITSKVVERLNRLNKD